MQKRAKKRGKILVNFEIEPEWADRIAKVAKSEERSKSSLVRLAIKEYVKRAERIAKNSSKNPCHA